MIIQKDAGFNVNSALWGRYVMWQIYGLDTGFIRREFKASRNYVHKELGVQFGVRYNPSMYIQDSGKLIVWLPGVTEITHDLVVTERFDTPEQAASAMSRLTKAFDTWNKSAREQIDTGWELESKER